MSAGKIVLLGAIAGLTIFLGLPIGRLRAPALRTRALLNATAIGVLLFLLWDVLAHAWEPVEHALGDHQYGAAFRDGLVMAAGVCVGLAGLVYFDRWVSRKMAARRAARVPIAAGTPHHSGRGEVTSAVAVDDGGALAADTQLHSSATQLALLIAIGIGLHNFAEGLAIGNSAVHGEMALALMLVIGFGLHNATEGFGIVAPLAGAGVHPSWRFLALLGLIGGGPTFVGTVVGQQFVNDTISVAMLALAAGSILYVVIELLAVGRKMAVKEITTWGLLAGLILGFVTDGILVAAGA